MAGIAEFTIVIDDGPTIRVDYKSADGKLEQVVSRSLKLNPVHRRTIDFLIRLLREGRLVAQHEYEVLGENLFATLFYDDDRAGLNEIGNKLTEAMRSAGQTKPGDDNLLRITLDFQESRADLSSWPWEYLFSPERRGESECNFFIAQKARMALTRYLALSSVREANPAQPPLRVLLVAPSSEEMKVESSSVLEGLQELHKKGEIKLTCLPPIGTTGGQNGKVTFRDFTSTLGLDPHVIHFVGHGKHEMQEGDRAVGKLAFTDETGAKAIWVSDHQLANAIADYTQSVHLVFLQACESAETITTSSYQAIAGVAQSVSQKSVPAVVAMHYRVLGATGNALAREFYGELAKRRSVLLALNHARKEVFLEADDQEMWAAFGLPVLYLRGTGVILPSEFDTELPSTMGGNRPHVPSRRMECPWDRELVEVGSGKVKCPACQRLLICPECHAPRTWKSNKCSNCEQRTYDDAERPVRTVASSYEETETTDRRRLG
jgi:hypothetical protein